MGRIVAAVGASHAPGLIGLIDKAPEDVQTKVQGAYRSLGETIRGAEPDVLIVIANDHVANNKILRYPDYLIGMAEEHVGPHEWFRPWLGVTGPDYHVPGNPAVAETLFRGLSRHGIRVFARDENLIFDDNLSIPLILSGFDRGTVSLVPILCNHTVPPVPDQHRSYAFGQAMGRIIAEDLPADTRVALYASGGLSHEPGGARYFHIDEAFDHRFLELLEAGDHSGLLEYATLERMDEVGAGGTTELLAWIAVIGAIGEKPCETLCYAAVEEWKCGIGAVRWSV